MKYLVLAGVILLGGCSTTSRDQLYYDAAKSISRDSTVAQSACWAAVGEIGKSGDAGVKVAAIALAEKCKVESPKIEAPKRNLLGF